MQRAIRLAFGLLLTVGSALPGGTAWSAPAPWFMTAPPLGVGGGNLPSVAGSWLEAKGGAKGSDVSLKPPTSQTQDDDITAIEQQEGARVDENKRRMTRGQPINPSAATTTTSKPNGNTAAPRVARDAGFSQPGSGQFYRCRQGDGRVVIRNFGCREGESLVNNLPQ